MTYYSVLDVSPTTDAWVADYINPVNKISAKYGGKFLARTTNHEQIEGEASEAVLRIIIEWPSKQAALDFTTDPEYVPHLQARIAGSVSNHYLIEAKDDLA